MTTRSFWILSSLFSLMLLVGLITTNSFLIALTFPLIVYLIVAVSVAPGEQNLQAKRFLSTDRITQGMDFTVRIQVTNQNARIDELHLAEFESIDSQAVEGETSKITVLNPGNSINYEYTLQGRRGSYRFEALLASVTDPFGMFEIQEQLPAAGNVLVYPEIINLKGIPIRPPQTKGFSGPIPSRKSGIGMDFFGVRQYQLGDSLRRINWKTSARHTVDLYTNEYEQERIADVGLILDARPHCDVSFQGSSLFEYSVQAAASLAKMFLNEGHCLSMLVYSAGISRVFPGYGKVQFERILNALAHADTGINYVTEHLRYFPARFLPPRCQLVYISPLPTSDIDTIMLLRYLGYSLYIISPDPLYFERQNEPDPSQPDFQLAERFATIERHLLLSNLRQAGIQVVNWQVDQPLSDAIDEVCIQNLLLQRAVKVRQ